jgi:hypothetical protein
MPEIDLRGQFWIRGFPRPETLIDIELYRLLVIFGASETICSKRRDDDDQASVYGWSIRYFEFAEIGRILLSLAVMLRGDLDAGVVDETMSERSRKIEIGELVEDVDAGSKPKRLDFRESLNKIIHAQTANIERSIGETIVSGHLLPRIHLYGSWKERNWKASINIYNWAEVAHFHNS